MGRGYPPTQRRVSGGRSRSARFKRRCCERTGWQAEAPAPPNVGQTLSSVNPSLSGFFTASDSRPVRTSRIRLSTRVWRCPATYPEHGDTISGHVETGADYGNHRAGRILPRGAVAVERIRGPRHRSPSGTGRPGESSQTAGNGPGETSSARRVFRELREPASGGAEMQAGRVLPPGGAELCQLLVRRRVFDAANQYQRDALCSGCAEEPGAGVPVLLRRIQRNVWQSRRGAADRAHALSSALHVWHQQSGGLRADAQLPRSVSNVRQ